jgi:hypothetical protein
MTKGVMIGFGNESVRAPFDQKQDLCVDFLINDDVAFSAF